MKNPKLCENIKGKLLHKLCIKYNLLDIDIVVDDEGVDDEKMLFIRVYGGNLWSYEVTYDYDKREPSVGFSMNDFFAFSSSGTRKYVFYFEQLSQALNYLTGIRWEHFIESTERSLS